MAPECILDITYFQTWIGINVVPLCCLVGLLAYHLLRLLVHRLNGSKIHRLGQVRIELELLMGETMLLFQVGV